MLSNDVVIPPTARSEAELLELVEAKAERRRRRSRLGHGGLALAACLILLGAVFAARDSGSGSTLRTTGNTKGGSSALSAVTTIEGAAAPGDPGVPLLPGTSDPARAQSPVLPPSPAADEPSPPAQPSDSPPADAGSQPPDTTTAPPPCSPDEVVAVAAVDKATYHAGDTYTLSATVTNVSSHPCDPPCGEELAWRDASGNPVGGIAISSCVRPLTPVPWLPGESIPSPFASSGPIVRPGIEAPGTYSAVVTWSAGSTHYTATTPPFEILPA